MENKDSEQWKLPRRDFLVLAGGIIGAISLGNLLRAGLSHAAAIEFLESKCGDKSKIDKKILVAYASKYGSTSGVADAIGKELCSKGAAVDVSLTKNVGTLSTYQGVVVGSAIYRGKWLPDAVDFVKTNREVLRRVPVAYFLVCMTMCDPTEENRRKVLAYLDPVLKTVPQVKPVGIATLAGALDYSNLSWVNKKILRFKGVPEGDFRDWAAIRAWAGQPTLMKSMGM